MGSGTVVPATSTAELPSRSDIGIPAMVATPAVIVCEPITSADDSDRAVWPAIATGAAAALSLTA